MQLYLAWTRQNDHAEGEADPIGLILCGSQDNAMIELLLADPDSSPDKRIKVAQYLLPENQDALKKELTRLSAARGLRSRRRWARRHAGPSAWSRSRS